MALRTLNTTNARATAKPVSTKGMSNLNAFAESIQAASQAAGTFEQQELIKKEEQLEKDIQMDLAKVEEAKLNGQNVGSVEVLTEKGQEYRDDKYTTDIATENKKEAYMETAKAGKTMKDAKSINKQKAAEDIMALGTPEQKALLTKKSNSIDSELSNNAFQQEYKIANEERRDYDTKAATMAFYAGSGANLENDNQRAIHTQLSAGNDLGIILNQNALSAVENGWSSEKQVEHLKDQVAGLAQKNKDPKYVNSLYSGLDKTISQIRIGGAKKSAERAIDMQNKSEEARMKQMIEDRDQAYIKHSGGFGAFVNSAIDSKTMSVLNAKSAVKAEIYRSITDGVPVPQDVVDFLKADRPDGRAGWFYTDPSIGNSILKHNNSLKAVGKVEKSSEDIAKTKHYLDSKTEMGSLNKSELLDFKTKDLISKKQYETYLGHVLDQNDLINVSEGVLDIANNSNLSAYDKSRAVDYSLTSIGKNTDDYKRKLSNSIAKSYIDGKTVGSEVNMSIEGQITALASAPAEILGSMMLLGTSPDFVTNYFNRANPAADPDGFIKAVDLFDSLYTDSTNGIVNKSGQEMLKASMSTEAYEQFENYIKAKQSNPELDHKETISIVNSATAKKTNSYSDEIYNDIDRASFNKEVNSVTEEFTDSWWFGQNKFEGMEQWASNEIKKEASVLKTINPGLSSKQAISMAKDKINNNYTVIDGMTIRTDKKFTESQKETYYDEDNINAYKKAMAGKHLGSEDRFEEIMIYPSSDNSRTGLYNVALYDPSTGSNIRNIGNTFMLDTSKDGIPSYQSFVNKRESLKSQREFITGKMDHIRGARTSNDYTQYASIHKDRNYSDKANMSKQHKNLAENNRQRELLEKQVTFDNLSDQLVLRGVKPRMSNTEKKSGKYNVPNNYNGLKLGHNKVSIEDLNDEQAKQLFERNLNLTYKEYNKNEEFKKLPIKIQHRIVAKKVHTGEDYLQSEIKQMNEAIENMKKEEERNPESSLIDFSMTGLIDLFGTSYYEQQKLISKGEQE